MGQVRVQFTRWIFQRGLNATAVTHAQLTLSKQAGKSFTLTLPRRRWHTTHTHRDSPSSLV